MKPAAQNICIQHGARCFLPKSTCHVHILLHEYGGWADISHESRYMKITNTDLTSLLMQAKFMGL
jgi:hypothetical protein